MLEDLAPLALQAKVVSSPRHVDDLAFAQQVVSGDAAAWERFVERYAGLIYSVVRKYLPRGDRDDVRAVFVDVLVAVKRAKLATYEGRAALSTWLTLVARSEALDFLRRRFGRTHGRREWNRLTPTERMLFRLYYLEGRSPHEVVAQLGQGGERWTVDRFIAALRQIERRLGDAWLRRLRYDLHAQSVGAASGRMLEYLDHVRAEFADHPGAHSPEYHMMEREARATADLLTEKIRALEPQERDLLRLRFEHGWTARRIARELGLESARSVYSTTDRIVRKLRRWLGRDDP
jgi:DNA-directed RNA polymerase specialized sigma24 family protein